MNVARVAAGLGELVRTVVVIGGATGDEILRDLERSGLGPVPVRAPGESRTCLEVIDEADGSITQLHEAGVSADSATARTLAAAVEAELQDADWLALCGSLAPGLPLDCYATLIRAARSRGVAVALDSSGEALRLGAAVSPDLLRINRDEAVAVDGLLEAGIDASARFGIISDGGREVVAWSRGERALIAPPAVRVRNAIGCGDTMLAGMLARIDRSSFEEAIRFATALASAAAERDVVGGDLIDRATVLASAVRIRAIASPIGEAMRR